MILSLILEFIAGVNFGKASLQVFTTFFFSRPPHPMQEPKMKPTKIHFLFSLLSSPKIPMRLWIEAKAKMKKNSNV